MAEDGPDGSDGKGDDAEDEGGDGGGGGGHTGYPDKEDFTELVLGGDGGGGDEELRICEWLARHAVSLHLHGRAFASVADAAEALQRAGESHLRVGWAPG